jgi:hypothetical protein
MTSVTYAKGGALTCSAFCVPSEKDSAGILLSWQSHNAYQKAALQDHRYSSPTDLYHTIKLINTEEISAKTSKIGILRLLIAVSSSVAPIPGGGSIKLPYATVAMIRTNMLIQKMGSPTSSFPFWLYRFFRVFADKSKATKKSS